jgi:hypothetical protein
MNKLFINNKWNVCAINQNRYIIKYFFNLNSIKYFSIFNIDNIILHNKTYFKLDDVYNNSEISLLQFNKIKHLLIVPHDKNDKNSNQIY